MGGGCPKMHCSTEEFAFSSVFASFFGNAKRKSLAGLRRKPNLERQAQDNKANFGYFFL